MIRQYRASPYQPSLPMLAFCPLTPKGRKPKNVRIEYAAQNNDFGRKYQVGTIPVGTILYLQDRGSWNDHVGPICRNPWQVMAWLNRDYHAHHRGPDGKYLDVKMLGGHLALVKSLRNGEEMLVSAHTLLQASDAGLEKHVGRKKPEAKPAAHWYHWKKAA